MMSEPGQLDTVGAWKVKAGQQREFIEAWQEFAQWTADHLAGVGSGRLLQDMTDDTRFVSFGPWSSLAAVGAWRELPEFKAFFVRARELCEQVAPQTVREVASATAHERGRGPAEP